MKHPRMLFPILFSVALCFNSAQAQTTPNVCHAQLFFADINTQGKVVTSGNTLVFIDEKPRERWILTPPPAGDSEAFTIDKSNISERNQQSGTLSIYTKRMVKYRGREERHITFRFTAGNCNAVVAWLNGRSQAQSKQDPYKTGKQRFATGARLRRFMRPDISGELIIWDDMITFGNRGKGRYQWQFRDIKDIRQEGAYVFQVIPFVGGEFTFDLQDRFSLVKFTAVRNRILR